MSRGRGSSTRVNNSNSVAETPQVVRGEREGDEVEMEWEEDGVGVEVEMEWEEDGGVSWPEECEDDHVGMNDPYEGLLEPDDMLVEESRLHGATSTDHMWHERIT
jgi:hypothetical protein